MSKQNPEEGHLQGCKNKNTHIWGVIMEKTENRFKLARTAYNQHGKQSVKTVSEETGISKSLIDDLESNVGNKREVSYLKVKKLAEYYGVTSDYLLGIIDCPSADYDLQSVYYYTGLSVEAVEAIRNNQVCDEIDPGMYMLNLVLQKKEFWDLLYSLDELRLSSAGLFAKVKNPNTNIPFVNNPIVAVKADYLEASDNFTELVNALFNYRQLIKAAKQAESIQFEKMLIPIEESDFAHNKE